MKVAVINFSGNVGKSTIARHLLAPRMHDATIIPVETINSDGSEDEAIKGKQFGELLEALSIMDEAVIDVGASNVEDFVNLMKQYKGSHEDFDFFVVPTVPDSKQMRDTISTIDALAEIGVPAKKIRLIFNRVEFDDMPEKVFPGLFDYHASEKTFTLKKDAVIRVNDIYGKLKGDAQNIGQILADTTDYKALIKESKDQGEKLKFAQFVALRRLAAGVTEDLDAVFKVLFK
ncbi:StbB family protein [Pseudomonas sp. WS 5027]|jgi:hypothetical protein|uniref:StbB family protein n=1 Tax=Pseudomonas sp. WS 5027 TaxID=2717483 RepID=UPI0014741858|nr:StbB family protein [Pseudomonas sp. WS 5027]NMY49318.1 StbB [Pseudomonas sp. WS 5027]